MAKKKPIKIYTGTPLVDKALDHIHDAFNDLLTDPSISINHLPVTLPNATVIKLKHGLGRPYIQCLTGSISGAVSAGYINDVTPADNKPKEVWLEATGYGATITAVATVS